MTEEKDKDIWEEEEKPEVKPGEEEKDDKKVEDPKSEEDLFKKEDGEPEEGKGVKKDSKDQKLETEEEKKAPANVKAKARVRKREEEQSDHERRIQEAKEASYADEDFTDAQKFEFSNNEIEVEGEMKSLSKIAEEYPDVAALVKDAFGRLKKELGAPLKSTQDYIENNRFWEKVETKHPGARSMKSDEAFMAWVDADEDLQTLSSTGNPDDIIFILDSWKEKITPKVDKVKEAKKNLLAKSGGNGSSADNKPVSDEEGEVLTEELSNSIWE